LTVCGSNNRLCSPRLRQAASPLAAIRGDSAVEKLLDDKLDNKKSFRTFRLAEKKKSFIFVSY